ncbi:MAG: CBS domain-containing protein [Actinobacteria bacterium]|nr:CBS domain-containing protein [Actinomycetota bacterium]
MLRDGAEQTAQHLVTQLSRVLSATDGDQPSPAPPPATDQGSTPGMRVHEVMTSEVRMVTATASLRAAAATLFAAGISGMPVVGDDGALIGVITTADLLARQAPPAMGIGAQVADRRRRHDAVTAADACSSPAIVVTPDATVRDAARHMLDHDVARLVVIDRGAIVGIVSRHDVLAALLRADDLIAAAIDKVLRDRDETAVTAAVSDGVVTLTGAVGLRSVAAALPRIVSGLDGVVSVETNLRWDTDDVRPVAPTH